MASATPAPFGRVKSTSAPEERRRSRTATSFCVPRRGRRVIGTVSINNITVVKRITSDEEQHVDVIVGLLRARQVEPSREAEPIPLAGIASWDTGSAITSR